MPEKREERTTEGGIDAAGQHNRLKSIVTALGAARIRVSMFIEPDRRQLDASKALGAPVVELHTGAYANAAGAEREEHLNKIREAAAYGDSIGLEVHAGHGLTYENVKPIAAIPHIRELNIGHFLIGEAVFVGLEASIGKMRALMDKARTGRLQCHPRRARAEGLREGRGLQVDKLSPVVPPGFPSPRIAFAMLGRE